MKKLKKNVIELILLIIILLLMTISTGCSIRIIKEGQYRYADMVGNIGEANSCYESYGNLICKVENKYIQVREYEIIY